MCGFCSGYVTFLVNMQCFFGEAEGVVGQGMGIAAEKVAYL